MTVLVNNAMYNRYGPLEEQTEEMIARMIDVGFKGVIWGYQAVLPAMTEAGGGAIVNIASPSAVIAMRHGVIYSAIKAAVAASTRSAAAEFGPRDIRVTAIAPGSTRPMAPSLSSLKRVGRGDASACHSAGSVPPQDVANAAVFLASDEAIVRQRRHAVRRRRPDLRIFMSIVLDQSKGNISVR